MPFISLVEMNLMIDPKSKDSNNTQVNKGVFNDLMKGWTSLHMGLYMRPNSSDTRHQAQEIEVKLLLNECLCLDSNRYQLVGGESLQPLDQI